MNVFVSDPYAAMLVAHQTVTDRVNQAQAHARARAARTERRYQRQVWLQGQRQGHRAGQRQNPPVERLPRWSFLRPAH